MRNFDNDVLTKGSAGTCGKLGARAGAGAWNSGSWNPSSKSSKSPSASAPSSKSSKSSPKSSSSSSSPSASSPSSSSLSAASGGGVRPALDGADGSAVLEGCRFIRGEFGVDSAGDTGGRSTKNDARSTTKCSLNFRDLYIVPELPPSSVSPSGLTTKSAGASALRFSKNSSECGPESPGASSTTVLGMTGDLGALSAVDDASLLFFSWIAISSGSASPSLKRYASVPGTSPYDGSSSTFSTRVLGIGDVPGLRGADCASEK